ncbi:transposase family protein [Spiroplasma endosymbiont of Phyllotreta cruciferae]|uniref:transposase family protein n=1 Tax=Spiroplasma endosymbiont of Phyllotreta cruciferae TaxID=2886375 RepID=UPI00209DB6ED|nr:transposase family protein [Spiroplasma endosymbiont of Phyllotreta cruciferae]
MARKGQKYNKYTSEFRTKIIEEIKQKSCWVVAKQYNLNANTVESWWANHKKGKLNNHKGPKISFGKRDLEYYKTRYELLKNLHDFYN